MALLEHRSRIRFRAEHRLLAGVYECIANNGVGEPARAAVRVVIQGMLYDHKTPPDGSHKDLDYGWQRCLRVAISQNERNVVLRMSISSSGLLMMP